MSSVKKIFLQEATYEKSFGIFQLFFTTKPQGEGTGLGLGIVKKIVDKYKGKINFESLPGITTFVVKFPIV